MRTTQLRRRFVPPLAAAILIATNACAGAPSPTTLVRPEDRPTSPRLISTAALRGVEAASVLQAIERLRPEFLHAAATSGVFTPSAAPSVYENDRYLGGLEQLARIPLPPVVEIARLTPVEARIAYGAMCQCAGGVISVRTKP